MIEKLAFNKDLTANNYGFFDHEGRLEIIDKHQVCQLPEIWRKVNRIL